MCNFEASSPQSTGLFELSPIDFSSFSAGFCEATASKSGPNGENSGWKKLPKILSQFLFVSNFVVLPLQRLTHTQGYSYNLFRSHRSRHLEALA